MNILKKTLRTLRSKKKKILKKNKAANSHPRFFFFFCGLYLIFNSAPPLPSNLLPIDNAAVDLYICPAPDWGMGGCVSDDWTAGGRGQVPALSFFFSFFFFFWHFGVLFFFFGMVSLTTMWWCNFYVCLSIVYMQVRYCMQNVVNVE